MNLKSFGWNPWSYAGTLGWNPPWVLSNRQRWDASMVAALLQGRGPVPPTKAPSVSLDPIDKPDNYFSWSYDVRMALLVTEFLSRISIGIDKAKEEVVVAFAHTSGPTTMAALKRPSPNDILKDKNGLKSTLAAYPPDFDSIAAMVAQNESVDEFMLRAAGLTPEKNFAQFELARALSILSNLVCLRLKQAFAVPRPHMVSAKVQPLLPVPEHSSFPGGHATIASAVAVVIDETSPAKVLKQQMALAKSIADCRVSAGLHYNLDTYAGLGLGYGVASTLVSILKSDEKSVVTQGPVDLPLLGALWKRAKP